MSSSHRQGPDEKATENPNVNAEEQMETLSEGKVARAVEHKSGAQMAPGDNDVVVDDFSSGIERKKAEQANARNKIRAERDQGMDVDGSLGQERRNENSSDV